MIKFRLLGDWAPNSRKVKEFNLKEFSFLNLEGPILNQEEKKDNILKSGPTLSNDNFIKSNHDGVVVLSNNHLFDYGLSGYHKTLEKIKLNNWLTVGVGENKTKSIAPLIFELGSYKIAVLSRCESQFGVSQLNKAGVAAFDASIYNQIYELKNKVDLIIVSYHAGLEMSPWPSPNRQNLCRSFLDAGADIVYGHHAHTPQGWEEYKHGLIFYGLGNFCVDPKNWNWHPNALWSLSPVINIIDGKINYEINTLIIEDNDSEICIRNSTKQEKVKHQKYLDFCNKPLNDNLFLESLWQEVSFKMYNNHYLNWLGFNNFSKNLKYIFLEKFFGKLFLKLFFNKDKQLLLKRKYLLHYHLFKCESHNDAISTVLGILGGEVKDLRNKKTKDLVDELVKLK